MENVYVGKSVVVNDDNFIFCRRTYTVKQLEQTIYCVTAEDKHTSKELDIYLRKSKVLDHAFTLDTGDVIDVIQECYTSNSSACDVIKVSTFYIAVNGLRVASRESYSTVLAAFEKMVRHIEGL